MLAELALEGLALPLGVSDPLGGDRDGVLGVEEPSVVGELSVAVSDGGSQVRFAPLGCGVGLGRAGEHSTGVVDVLVVE